MKIIIEEDDIKEAVKAHLASQGLSFGDSNVDVSFTAGRGTNGMTATIEIGNSSTLKPVIQEKTEVPSESFEEDTKEETNSLFQQDS